MKINFIEAIGRFFTIVITIIAFFLAYNQNIIGYILFVILAFIACIIDTAEDEYPKRKQRK